MIPQTNELLLNFSRDQTEMPSITYMIKGNRITSLIDGKEALIQSINLMLQTERFEHVIYSWDYGCELASLYALDPDLTKVRLKQRIEEALLTDSRIKSVEDFSISQDNGKYFAKFTVNSVFGSINYDMEG